jgi:6,7-dimethyl-8-ribityllumazine synthase
MAGHAPSIGIKPLPNAKVAIISSSWHLELCNDLIAGAQRALTEAQVGTVEVQFVPGSFEIPLAAQYAFEAGFDAVVAVGLVLKGETPHFDYVCQGVTQGVIELLLVQAVPEVKKIRDMTVQSRRLNYFTYATRIERLDSPIK